jgi:hypothetical protein
VGLDASKLLGQASILESCVTTISDCNDFANFHTSSQHLVDKCAASETFLSLILMLPLLNKQQQKISINGRVSMPLTMVKRTDVLPPNRLIYGQGTILLRLQRF